MDSSSNQQYHDLDADYDYEQDNILNDEESDRLNSEDQTRQQPNRNNESSEAHQSTGTNRQRNSLDQAELRKKIIQIQHDTSVDPKQKARMMQHLMSHGVLPATPTADTHKNKQPQVQTEDIYAVSYHKKEDGILGCQHYQRNCKLQAACCEKIFVCRFCHDEASDHAIVRVETKNMLCMLCKTIQPAGKDCHKCGEQMAAYYCDKCKLWDNIPNKEIYHCDDCGICRRGKGLGEDFFHCMKCNICMVISIKDKHRCIERNLESDCPICGEYMFTSTAKVIFMPCGHCIHKHCYETYLQRAYQCPTCLKSLCNMEDYFNRLDQELQRQPMPAEYENYLSYIFCNDCEEKSVAKYHFFYHKCKNCKSYNTTVLKTENKAKASSEKNSNDINTTLHEPEAETATGAEPESSLAPTTHHNDIQDHSLLSQAGDAANHIIGALSSLSLLNHSNSGRPGPSSSTPRNENRDT